MESEQLWQGPMLWPVDRTAVGDIVMVRIELSGPLSRQGFERLREFVELWGQAWYPEAQEKEAQSGE